MLGIAALFTYGMAKGKARMAEHNVRAVCLTNFDEVVAAAAEDGAFQASYVPALTAFRDNPDDASWMEALK